MASLFGTDGGTLAGGGRRPTNAGYPATNPFGFTTATATAVPRGSGGTAGPNPSGGTAGRTYDSESGIYPANSPEDINWINQNHPEYSGGKPATPTTPNYNWNWLNGGYDRTKLQDTNHNTAKYQLGRTFAQFDPHGGVNDAVLGALNKLGFGTYYGSGDQLGIRGVTAAGRAAGLDSHDFSGDFIQGFHSNNPLWGYDAWQDPYTTAAGSPSVDPFAGLFSGAAPAPAQDMSWIADLIKSFAPHPTDTPVQSDPGPSPVSPPLVINAPGASYSQPSPTFSGGYVQPGFGSAGDATSVLSMALPRLLSDPNAMNSPLMRQLLSQLGVR